jgi:predicted secreted Zn-dependent protease
MALTIAPTVTRHYDVHGDGLAEVVRAFPDGDEVGSCTWNLDLEYEGVTRQGVAREIRLDVTIAIETPRWAERDAASEAERREWDRFHHALLSHERGHEQRVRTNVRDSYSRLTRTPVGELAAVFEEERQRIQAVSDAYDAHTDHGRKPPPGTNITIP